MTVPAPPSPLQTLVERFDHEVFDVRDRRARVRLEVRDEGAWDVELAAGLADFAEAIGGRPDALLSADAATWQRLTRDLSGGMTAFRSGRLRIRHDLHLGVGFLAATAQHRERESLVFRQVSTEVTDIAVMEAGAGPPVLLLHG